MKRILGLLFALLLLIETINPSVYAAEESTPFADESTSEVISNTEAKNTENLASDLTEKESNVNQDTYEVFPEVPFPVLPKEEEQQYIVRLNESNVKTLKAETTPPQLEDAILLPRVDRYLADLTPTDVNELIREGTVEYVELDQPIELAANKVETKDLKEQPQSIPWGVYSVGANLAPKSDKTNKKVKVAVFDTGISPHPELNVKDGVSFVEDETDYADHQGHGTHMAGTISAVDDTYGIVGVSPNVELYSVKVINAKGKGYTSSVVQGIDWAINHHIDIINISFTSMEYSDVLEQAIQNAREKGILVFAAAGNAGNGENNVRYPAQYPGVIGVGAVNTAHARATFSSTGEGLDLMAPGTNILSTYNHQDYAILSGTSSATAFASGAAALLWEHHPDWTANQVADRLTETATSLGESHQYGKGLINVAKALGIIDGNIAPLTDGEDPSLLTVPVEEPVVDSDLTLASYDHLGNGKSVAAGQPITVSLKLNGGLKGENVHTGITITVSPTSNPSQVINGATKKITNPNLNVDIPFTWNTKADTPPGTYEIRYRYDSIFGDDTFNVTVTSPEVVPPVEGEISDTYENNNTFAQARLINEGSTYTSYISVENDLDYYKFVATNTREATVTLRSTRGSAFLLNSYDNNQNALNSIEASSGQENSTKIRVEAGKTYYLKVQGNNGYFGNKNYSLSIDGYVAPTLMAPQNVTTFPSYTSINMTWDAMENATSYIVKVNGNIVATPTDNVFNITGLRSLTSYSLSVAAVYETGTSAFTTIRETTQVSELIVNNPQDIQLPAGSEQLFSFRPATTGIYRIFTSGYNNRNTQNDTNLKIFEDASQSTLLFDNDDYSNTTFSELKIPLDAGKTYYVLLSGFDGVPLEARITATVISSTIPYLTVDEAQDIDESKKESTVYVFVPGATASYKLFTSYYKGNKNIRNDTKMTMYSDISMKQMIPGGTDDDSGGDDFSKLELKLSKGTPYYIKIESYDKVYARLMVSAMPIDFPVIQNQEYKDISLVADESSYFAFTPAETGKYRFFTTYYTGNSAIKDTHIALYSDSALSSLMNENDNVEGKKPYGATWSKVETTLQAGTTYYLVVKNKTPGTAMKAKVQVEDAFQSEKSKAQVLQWDDLYSTDARGQRFQSTSLYDVDFYRVSLSSAEQVNINIFDGVGNIENKNGGISGIFSSDGEKVFWLSAGEYYFRVDNTLGRTWSISSAKNYISRTYKISLYINKFETTEREENDFSIASEDPGGNGSTTPQSFTPGKNGSRNVYTALIYSNKNKFDSITYQIYPKHLSGSLTNRYTAYQKTLTRQSGVSTMKLDWDGTVRKETRDILALVSDGYFYAKDGDYQLIVYPKVTGDEIWRVSREDVVTSEIIVKNKKIYGPSTGKRYPTPPTTFDGTPNTALVKAGEAQSCGLCKEYYKRYVYPFENIGVGDLQQDYQAWFRKNYGETSLQKFFSTMDRLKIVDPNASPSEVAHEILGAGEAIPVFSVFSGGANSILYLSEGEYTQASLSAAGMVPVVGTVKVAYKVIKAGKSQIVTDTVKMVGLTTRENAAKMAKATCNCFVAGTEIETKDGERPIEDIQIGDQVLSKNAETGEQAYKKVTALYRNEKEITYKLTVNHEIIETTDNHPFWVEGKGWVVAVDLQVGDQLKQSNGHTLTIDQIEIVKHDQKVKVYNFTVADFHTYFVSDLDIWVHNIDCFDLDIKPIVTNQKLKNVVEELYKGQKMPILVGNGTTMDAIRSELKTGIPVGGRFHTIKGQNSSRALQKLINGNLLDNEDKEIAKALYEDLQKALNGN